MDFIERIFGVSPDGGTGAFEFMLFVLPVIGLYILYQHYSRSTRRKR
jgi:hypothetical protein